MQGSLFPNGVIVDCAALSRADLTKAAEILRNRADWTCRGVYSGGVVTPNGVDNTKIDVAQLSGFCPNGEYIETTQGYTLIELDDDTVGVDNYVCAVYTELNDRNQPHETDGLTYPTRSSMAYRIRVYSETNYLALLATDANLANDARDRMLVLAVVNANGAGQPITTADITLPTQYNNLMYADPSDLHTITGVTITGVSSGTSRGTGTVGYSYIAGPTYTLNWTSPTGGIGADVNPTVDGSYTLPDGSGEYIIVDVVISQLPLTTPHTETVEVYNLYYQQVPRQSAEDFLHRNMIGSGIITPNNPHGLSYDDLYGSDASLMNQHRDVEHCNGIWRGSSVNIFFPGILATGGGDTLTVVAPAAGDLYFINGEKLDKLDQTSIQFIPANVPCSASGSHFFEVYVTDTEDFKVLDETNQPKASYPPGRNMTGTWISDMSPSYPAGAYLFSDLVIGTVHTFQWDGGQTVSVDTATDPSQMIRLYDATGVNWVDVWVNLVNVGVLDADVPGVGIHNDTITVNASPDWDQNMQIYSLPGWYDPINFVFKIGTAPYGAVGGRSIIDKKPWGTLCADNMADSALQQLIYHSLDELQFSGVLLRRNGDYNEFEFSNPGAPSNVVEITGGDYYCRGRRLTFEGSSVTLSGISKRYLLYVDWKETIHSLNVTDDFAGDLQAAMRYVLGSTKYIPDVLEDIHESDDFDPPERGVLLYVVDTDAAPIVDDYIDMRRNVNGPVDPWSVANFAYSADAVSASFDNLYSAFAYAEYYRSYTPKFTDGLTITVVGETTVDRGVTQPVGVHVKGSIGSVSLSLINCTHSVAMGGAWELLDGCTVRDLNINLAVTGCLFSLNGDNCSIENCIYTNTGAVAIDHMIWFDVSGDYFKFIGNHVTTSGGVFFNVFAAPKNYHVISDNTVIQNTVYFDSVLMRITGTGHVVTGNNVQSLTSAASSLITSCIYLYTAYSCKVSENNIAIGGRDGTTNYCSGIGYDMAGTDTALASIVNNNIIVRNSGSTSDVDIGIYVVDGCNSLVIKDNIIRNCGVGVYIGGYYRDLSICGNQVYSAKYRGIYIVTARMTGGILYDLSIDNNIVDTMSSGTVVGVGWGINLRGIDVVIGGVADAILRHLCIMNNKISSIVNTVALGDAIGIYVDIQAGDRQINDQVTIKDNNISGLVGHSTGTTAGIEFYQISSVLSYTYGISICDNQVFLNSLAATGVLRGAYIDSYNIEGGSFDGNIIVIKATNASYVGGGLLFNISTDSSDKISISNNNITCLWTAILARCINSRICDNIIEAGSMGIVCSTITDTIIDGNKITVWSNNNNPYAAGPYFIGSDFNNCIAVQYNVGSPLSRFVISNNYTMLKGDSTLSLMKVGATVDVSSANIWVKDCDNWSIIGNTCNQLYDTLSSLILSNPSHIYCGIGNGQYFDIKENVINNKTRVASPSLTNGIYIENIGLPDNIVHGHVGGNTIWCTIEELPVATWENSGAAATPYELYMSDFATVMIAPTYNVFFSGNSLHLVWGVASNMPKVYIADMMGVGTGPNGSASNGGNYASTGPVAPCYW